MHGKKLAALAAIIGAALAAGPTAPALAGGGGSDYASCTITVDPSTFDPGATVMVVGTGLEPSFETPIEFNSVTVVVGTVTTDAEGGFETTITIPDDATEGAHTISVQCDVEGNVSVTDVEIEISSVGLPGNPSGETPTGLPRTGTDVEPLAAGAGAALLAGVTFVLVGKRRRRAAT